MVVKNLLGVLWKSFVEENEELGPRTIAKDVSVKTSLYKYAQQQKRKEKKERKKERKREREERKKERERRKNERKRCERICTFTAWKSKLLFPVKG